VVATRTIPSYFFSRLTGSGWKAAPKFTPPYPIAADRYDDLGVRFADLNGDGRSDIIYLRTISNIRVQKGSYISDGQKWVLCPKCATPNSFLSRNGDLGVKFVDLNADGKDDLVYHRKISSKVLHSFNVNY
jgi:hypothetical protein